MTRRREDGTGWILAALILFVVGMIVWIVICLLTFRPAHAWQDARVCEWDSLRAPRAWITGTRVLGSGTADVFLPPGAPDTVEIWISWTRTTPPDTSKWKIWAASLILYHGGVIDTVIQDVQPTPADPQGWIRNNRASVTDSTGRPIILFDSAGVALGESTRFVPSWANSCAIVIDSLGFGRGFVLFEFGRFDSRIPPFRVGRIALRPASLTVGARLWIPVDPPAGGRYHSWLTGPKIDGRRTEPIKSVWDTPPIVDLYRYFRETPKFPYASFPVGMDSLAHASLLRGGAP